MNTIITNGSPQGVLYGIDDQSVPPLVPSPVQTAIHIPMIFGYASKGPTNDAFLVSGDSLFSLYGKDVIDLKGPYATFNTPFLKMFNEAANTIMFQRIVGDDAKSASLRDYMEVIKTKVPNYLRNPDGSVQIDENGDMKTDGEIDGIKIVHRVGNFTEEHDFKNGAIVDGGNNNTDGTPSKVYPMWDMPAPWVGVRANTHGYRLSCLNKKTTTPVNPDMVSATKSRIFELQFVEQTEPGVSPTIIRGLSGQTAVTFSMKEEAYYAPLRLDLGLDDVVIPSYRNLQPEAGLMPEYGPVEAFYVYRENLEAVLNEIKAVIDPTGTLISDIYEIDFLTGLDLDGNPYNGLVVDNGELGGETFSAKHTHYLDGGSDGTLGNDMYDTLVRKEMDAFGEGTVNYFNVLKYPVTWLWDTGFTTDTKESLCNFMGRLKHTNVVLSTHVYNQPVNTQAIEDSMKIALSGFLRAHPESTKYGTGAVRGHVHGHSFKLNDSAYKEYVPASYALAKKTAIFAGAMDGKLKPEYKFTRGELAIVTEGSDVNLTYKPQTVYSSDWEQGLINIRSYDQHRFFYPALYSVYMNDRSILKGYFNAMIAADLELIALRVWAEMSGASDMTNEQIVKNINAKITEKVAGKYAGMVRIEPDAYFSPEDIANGYSVSININMYGNVPNTVHKYTIVAHRQEG